MSTLHFVVRTAHLYLKRPNTFEFYLAGIIARG